MTTTHGTHDYAADPRNAGILINVGGRLVPRAEAVVSVFDAGFVLGDGIWEGLRVSDGHPAFLEQHLDRLWEGAAAIMLDVGLTRAELTARLYETLEANAMSGDGIHIRLMVTRGPKSTPYQDPRMSAGPATVVIIAEYKDPLPSTVERGLSLFTVHVRRAAPDTLDPKLNAHSKLNDITACIQAYTAGADEALMLDPHGFVATCNSTHFFIVRGGEVWTSTGMYCLGGITRSNVLRVCREAGIPAHERSFSLTEVYSADEAFVTGTYAGLVPVHTVDGRRIGRGERGPMVTRLQSLYRDLVRADVTARGWDVTDGVRLAMWSGPRNISTALMRSWENRPDCRVVDEPLYAYYLNETGLNHPGRDEVIAAGQTSWQAVVTELTAPVEGIYYHKQMTHHLIPQLPRDWVASLTNVLLIRDPAEVVASYVRGRSDVVAEDIGLVQQAELYDLLGSDTPVIDSADFLRSPETYLRWLCDHVGVEFTQAMMRWPAGPRPSDGVWAPYWYDAVLASTGFGPYRPREVVLHGPALEAAERSRPFYERLHAERVRL